MRKLFRLVPFPMLAFALAAPATAQENVEEVPVTIKELDVRDTIAEFKKFERRLEQFRTEVSEGQKAAAEIASMLDELRESANEENGHNEKQILGAIRAYLEDVIGKQAGLVDFLQSQRYRISYYANRMAANVRPEDIAVLFGTESGNRRHLLTRTRQQVDASQDIARFIDTLSPQEFDRRSFRVLPALGATKRRQLGQLETRYQNSKNAVEIAKSRLRLVREAARAASRASTNVDLNVDLLLSQMFGTLDRIRLQMSRDLLYLETFLSRYERSARAQEILRALQQLVSLQGGMEAPSPGLANVLDWLEDSSVRKLTVLEDTPGGGSMSFPRSSDLLREAYSKGRGSAKE
ncbi:MAG: hypothetical protein V3T86_03805 [Planctomycetota bacterium]